MGRKACAGEPSGGENGRCRIGPTKNPKKPLPRGLKDRYSARNESKPKTILPELRSVKQEIFYESKYD